MCSHVQPCAAMCSGGIANDGGLAPPPR